MSMYYDAYYLNIFIIISTAQVTKNTTVEQYHTIKLLKLTHSTS
jgi:hypothetical protein